MAWIDFWLSGWGATPGDGHPVISGGFEMGGSPLVQYFTTAVVVLPGITGSGVVYTGQTPPTRRQRIRHPLSRAVRVGGGFAFGGHATPKFYFGIIPRTYMPTILAGVQMAGAPRLLMIYSMKSFIAFGGSPRVKFIVPIRVRRRGLRVGRKRLSESEAL